MDKVEINIGIFGCVSVGKSTLLNAITGRQYSDVEIKKTTMLPQAYLESDNPSDPNSIRQINRETNESIMKEIELGTFNQDHCKAVYHNIDRICDLLDPEIIGSNIKINVYDTPGLNDSSSKDIYFEWVRQNVKLFDIIIFMTDITKGLNNSDEYEVLNLLMDSVKKYNAKMICLINKCDDIYFDGEQNDLVFEETEQENIYIQANDILADIAKIHELEYNDKNLTPFLPISSENCFIYRALWNDPNCKLDPAHQNRLCKNECGSNQWKKLTHAEKEIVFYGIISNLKSTYKNKILDTGYLAVKQIIQNIIVSNINEFELNHLKNDISDLQVLTSENINSYIKLVENYAEKLKRLDVMNISHYDDLWNTIGNAINNYILLTETSAAQNNKNKSHSGFDYFDSFNCNLPFKGQGFFDSNPVGKSLASERAVPALVGQGNTGIKASSITCLRRDSSAALGGQGNNVFIYGNFEQFETFHSNMELYCINLSLLMNSFEYITGYPKDFFSQQQSRVMKKLLDMYDKFSSLDSIYYIHTRPSNLHHYLQIIYLYSPKNFSKYSKKFLKLMADEKCKHIIDNPSELLDMITYIADKCSVDDVHSHLADITKILIRKQQYIQSKFPKRYFQYMVGIKKLTKEINKSLPFTSFTPIDILYETTNKNILTYLEETSVSSFYKKAFENQKISLLLDSFDNEKQELFEFGLEKNLLTPFVPKLGFRKI